MSAAFLSGFITGGGLIIAVGAQNAFLLEQALKRHWALSIAILFMISDTLSISLGALGIGALIKSYPILLEVTRIAGVLFLTYFGLSRIKASFANEALLLSKAKAKLPLGLLLTTAMAVTWLNPHFYLDTLILMGSLANQWQDNTYQFIMGGVSASVLWFLTLTLIGRLLAPYLEKASFWRWLNRFNGTLVIFIAIQITLMSFPE
ncbi:lysine exporter [Marinomonas sp. SBI22]|uniref:LysE/ArgO family amino acid transporter n=1 Tax=unclassified Marinomonas TaxID=196814 RepID=UPI0007AF09C9|nr:MULTISPECIES: LysE family transporter [unclassified Marinomonas]KZM39959.1 lysine exporter [Marinomonas sp. SBI22]KZM41253.1 lysine exporter [Marinomonas sp. SBI8L]